MKKFFSFALVAALLAASTALVSRPAQAQGPGLVSSILNKMERNRRDLHSLRAALHMQKYNAQLHDYDESTGEVQYVAGTSGANPNVRVDWTKPARELLAISGGQYTLYRPRLNQAYQGSTKNPGKNAKVNNVLGFALNLSGPQAKNQFNIEYVAEGQLYDGGPQVWQLKLTPRGKAGYQYAEVWVDQSTGMPVQTRVTERNGDSTLVRLTNIERNPNIPSSIFDPQLPPGVKIVKG